MEEVQDMPATWGAAPREVLSAIFTNLPLKDRCQTVGGVCAWWRQVLLQEDQLLLDLNFNRLPLFAQRTRTQPDFYQQRASFTTWLLRRRAIIKRLSLTAERWEDDSQAVTLRLAVAEAVAANLEGLKLVCTESGQATSAFLKAGARLRELQLDFWGRSNGLPRAMADCCVLTKLVVQCSSGLQRYQVLASLKSLRDLCMVDGDWERVPEELLQLPLTRLHLRFADFNDGSWLPADTGSMADTLQDLSLPGCQISLVPEHSTQLSALTSLNLERNYIRELPSSLSRLRHLASLSCEGCSSLRELPVALAAALPLRSLNLLHTGILRLPLASGARRLLSEGDNGGSEADDCSTARTACSDNAAPSGSSSGGGGSVSVSRGGYLRQLTELRWGCVEWEPPHRMARGIGGSGQCWVGTAGDMPAADALPDLSPLLQASSLQVLQLAHVPLSAEGRLGRVQRQLPLLARLQVNSAILLPVA